MSGTTEQPAVVDDELVDRLARAMVARDGDSWDDPALTPDTPRSRTEEFRDSYRQAARDLLGDIVPAIRRRLFAELREAAGNDTGYMDTYHRIWQGIVELNGQPVVDLVARELHNYLWVMGQVAEVYCHATGGAMSKPGYVARAVCAAIDDYYLESYEQDLADERKGLVAHIVTALLAAGDAKGAEVARWFAGANAPGVVDLDELVLASCLTQCGWRDPATGAIVACDPTDVTDPPADGWQPVYVETQRADRS